MLRPEKTVRESIRITAEKYNGTARFSHDDKFFYIDVVMEV